MVRSPLRDLRVKSNIQTVAVASKSSCSIVKLNYVPVVDISGGKLAQAGLLGRVLHGT